MKNYFRKKLNSISKVGALIAPDFAVFQAFGLLSATIIINKG